MRSNESLLVFQVDLFNSRGEVPVNLAGVHQRQKDILYSSRTRYNSDMAAKVANTRQAICDLLRKLPARLQDDPDVLMLAESIRNAPTDIVQMIYGKAAYELESKDYEFSRASVLEHWRAGQSDMCDTITHPEWLKFSGLDDGVTQYCARRREVRARWAV
jgi:NTE family protein